MDNRAHSGKVKIRLENRVSIKECKDPSVSGQGEGKGRRPFIRPSINTAVAGLLGGWTEAAQIASVLFFPAFSSELHACNFRRERSSGVLALTGAVWTLHTKRNCAATGLQCLTEHNANCF